MNGNGNIITNCPANCTTVQIIEPNSDALVSIGGAASDVDESGSLVLTPGQTSAAIAFQVAKLTGNYQFEYLYVEAPGLNPGSVVVIPTAQLIGGFAVVFAGVPLDDGITYTLFWRVTVRQTTPIDLIDFPENLYLQMPRTNTMAVTFHNARSGIDYGFSELRVENLNDPPDSQAIIHVQVVQKTTAGFLLAVNPTPPSNFYFLKVRTP